jgi:hydroxymethylglutaryl-CoA lyase
VIRGDQEAVTYVASSTEARFLARLPKKVRIVEVAPRDGLQNEQVRISVEAKISFARSLAAAGFDTVELTSFVSPRAVPQLADADEVMATLAAQAGTRWLALVPNERGYDRARAAGCNAIALFTAASEAFSQANVRASIDETFERLEPVARRARADGVWMRGYVSTATDCPYSGLVDPEAAVAAAERLFEMGCAEVALADTIGRATPTRVGALLDLAVSRCRADRLALHFHDTSGLALANVMIGLDYGVVVYDAAAGGLGGCPFAPGAPGNLSTESLIDLLEGLEIDTGVDRAVVADAVSTLRQAYGSLDARAE